MGLSVRSNNGLFLACFRGVVALTYYYAFNPYRGVSQQASGAICAQFGRRRAQARLLECQCLCGRGGCTRLGRPVYSTLLDSVGGVAGDLPAYFISSWPLYY